MRTYDEVGNEVAKLILSGAWTSHELAVMLSEFARERIDDALEHMAWGHLEKGAYEKGFAECRERAAKMMDNCYCAHEGVAASIRALEPGGNSK